METYNLAYLTKKLYDTKLPVFSTKSLKDILEVKKESTYFSVVERLTKAEVIKKIETEITDIEKLVETLNNALAGL